MNLRLFFCLSLVISLFITLAIGSSSPTHAQSGQNVEFVGQIGGVNYAVFVQGNYAYIGEGPRLVILDVSNPVSPTVIGKSEPLPSVIRDIQVAGNYAYIADDDKGLQIIDISNLMNPIAVGKYENLGNVNSIYIVGNYAYLADGETYGLHIIDIHDVTNPVYISNYFSSAPVYDVQVKGDYAYIVTSKYHGLQVIDIKNPATPSLVTNYDGLNWVNNIDIQGDYLYIAGEGFFGYQMDIVDISDPIAFNFIGSCDISAESHDIFVYNNFAYLALYSGGLQIADVSNLSNPICNTTYKTIGAAVKSFAINGYTYVANVAYQPADKNGLEIINTNVSTNPSFVSKYQVSSPVSNVFATNKYAYVTSGYDGMQIMDITNPSNPVQLSNYDTVGWSNGVYVVGNLAYISTNDGNMLIVDVSDPFNPVLVKNFSLSGYVGNIYITGQYAYVSNDNNGLQIVDISNPSDPILVGNYDTPNSATDVQVVGKYAYIADWYSGLQIIDVSNPTNPTFVGSYNTPGTAQGIYVSNNYAYIADRSTGLQIVDISNPFSPTFVSSFITTDFVHDVYGEGTYAYLADSNNGLQIVDLSNPLNPSLVGYFTMAGVSKNLFSANSNIYLANNDGGLNILHYTGNQTPIPTPTLTLSPTPTFTPSPSPSATLIPVPTATSTPVLPIVKFFDDMSSWTSRDSLDANTAYLVFGDVDNNGYLDALAVNHGDNGIPGFSKKPSRLYRNINGKLSSTSIWISQSDYTTDAAFGDMNNDGYVDLAVANSGVFIGTPNKIYCSKNGVLDTTPCWVSQDSDKSTGVSWGDVDGDGDLDLAVANLDAPTKVYRNNNGVMEMTPFWQSNKIIRAISVKWTDMNHDGKQDLVIGGRDGVEIYYNTSNVLEPTPSWSIYNTEAFGSIALGDIDQDADLDLFIGRGYYGTSLAYHNVNGQLENIPFWSSTKVYSVLLGDVDGDNDLDLIDGSTTYLNDNGSFERQIYHSYSNINIKALGDIDQNGTLDGGVNDLGKPNRVYPNLSLKVQKTGITFSTNAKYTGKVAWGDVDGDGDLDLATSNGQLYLNSGGKLNLTPNWSISQNNDDNTPVAWGDVDNDNDLDLLVGQSLYLNNNGSLEYSPTWQISHSISSAAWADVDGDGDLDLAVGDSHYLSLYLNNHGSLQNDPIWKVNLYIGNTIGVHSIAWGDIDNDGDLDLAIANNDNVIVFLNDHGSLQNDPIWSISVDGATIYHSFSDIAWGDVDNDGDLDLAVARSPGLNELYLNEGGKLSSEANWFSDESEHSESIAWGDMDNDGDLDLVVGDAYIYWSSLKIYANRNGKLDSKAIWVSSDKNRNMSVALGDIDQDGDLDIAIGNYDSYGSDKVYLNLRSQSMGDSHIPTLHIQQPNKTSNANGYGSAEILSPRNITLIYTLFHSAGLMVDHLEAYYSLNGGGKWLPAVAALGTITQNLATSPSGTTHTFVWDTQASGFFGHSDNVVIRLVAIPSVVPQINGVAGEYRYGSFGAATLPFRARGSQIRVTNNGIPMSNAIVYRNGQVLVDGTKTPLQTDSQGYLQGQAELHDGDRLLALAPILTATQAITWTNAMTLYYTNGIPTATGMQMFEVTQPGVQELVVSADHPLLVFDLWVSVEFDASRDNRKYLDQLTFKLQQASQHLFDFTNGQVALGKITVRQNGDGEAMADVVIHSSNVMRPFATIGGLVITATVDGNKSYLPGQVHLPATWNRFGDALGSNESSDWSIIFAHELGHYLLFLGDTYIGVTPNDLLIAMQGCNGSAMGDVYAFDNSEFTQQLVWDTACANTLAHRLGQPDEWDQITHWYPWLKPPTNLNEGPSQLPIDLTTITILPPFTPTDTLANNLVYVDYAANETASSNALAYLIRNNQVYNLGSPIGGQNQLWARGARPNDRLCVFDPGRKQYGCELIEVGDEHLHLEKNATWQPIIRVSPINSTTFTIQVDGFATGLPLKARLYPQFGTATTDINLAENNGGYEQTIILAEPTALGYVQVWVDETDTETKPRREAMVGYAVSGGPGHHRGSGGGGSEDDGGGHHRGSGGGDRHNLGGGLAYSGEAPIMSPNGDFMHFNLNEPDLGEDSFYAIQDMASCPTVPNGKVIIDICYYLYATANAPILTGSVSIQYSTYDVLQEKVSEDNLTMYFWNGSSWQALDTYRDSYFNWASASSQGSGIYALMAGETTPTLLEITPTQALNNITNTVTITGLNFIAPLQVTLQNLTTSYVLPLTAIATTGLTTTLTAIITEGLLADEYNLFVTNLADQTNTKPVKFALYEPNESACFYDFFSSGLSKWQTQDFWQTIVLKDGNEALTDSPAKNYDSAVQYGGALTHTSIITTVPFNLANCPNPALIFNHDHVFVQGDVARVEVSANGQPWVELVQYTNDVRCQSPRTKPEDEWPQPHWQAAILDLSPYSQTTRIQLRFSLEVNQTCADKGWLIDDLMVKTYTGTIPTPTATPNPITATPTAIPTTATPPPTLTVTPTPSPTATNLPPKAIPVANQTAWANQWFSLLMPNPLFMDNEPLMYQVHLADGSLLPRWLSFDLSSWSLKGHANNDEAGDYVIVLSATDSLSTTTITTFTLTILGVNLPPVVGKVITQYIAIEDKPFVRDLNDVFTDTDPLSLTILSDLPPGVTFVDGILQGTVPNEGVGTYFIHLLATDTAFTQNNLWFELVVSNTNDAPLAQPDLASTQKNQATPICVLNNDRDVDKADSLTIIDFQTHLGQVVAETPCLRYTPPLDFIGLDTFTYTISDQQGLTSTAAVTIVIGGIQTQAKVVTTTEDMAVTIPLTLPMQFATTISGQLTLTQGHLIYLPPPNFYGEITLDYLASDKTTFSLGRIIITVLPINDAPIAQDDSVSIAYQPNITFTVLSNDLDPDHDVVTVTNSTKPLHGQLSLQANTFIYTPDMAYNGLDSFSYDISDGILTATAMVTIYVFAYPTPIALDDNPTLRQGASITFTPLWNDHPITGSLSLLQVQPPQHGVLQQVGSTLIYTPDLDFAGTEVLTYQMTDAMATAMGIISITVISDTPPVAIPDIITLTQPISIVLKVLANDFDNEFDPLTLTQTTQPLSGTAIISGSQLVYSPTLIFTGTDRFTYTISDGVLTATTTVTVVINSLDSVYLPILVKD